MVQRLFRSSEALFATIANEPPSLTPAFQKRSKG
jgi:hypothetical protein